jgi:hypothetical protein
MRHGQEGRKIGACIENVRLTMRVSVVKLVSVVSLSLPAVAQSPVLRLERSSLAPTARFVVTMTTAPKSGAKDVRTFKVELSGKKARVELSDKSMGEFCYVVNDKGTFLYIPATKSAQKMAVTGGIEQALGLAFAQASAAMEGASKSGKAVVSGQPTEIYRNERQGTTIYMGTGAGFRLPVKVETVNAGGRSTMLASSIRLGGTIPASRFALPAGTQLLEGAGGPGAMPGIK